MAVTAVQLMGQAQAEAFASAQPLPAPAHVLLGGPGRAYRDRLADGAPAGPCSRGAAAWEVYLTHRAAWPQLASAARYALASASAGQRARSRHGLVLEALERVERAIAGDIVVRGVAVPVGAVPDLRLLRGARFLAAAGDAMRVERPVSRAGMDDEVGSNAEAQVAATVAAFARLTTVYAEQAVVPQTDGGDGADRGGRPVEYRMWRDLVDRLDERTAGTDPRTRGNTLTGRPLPDTEELSLAGAMSRWRAAVEALSASSDEVGGISGADLDGVAHGMAMLHAAAAAAGAVGDNLGGRDVWEGVHAGAAQSWMAAADGWAGAVRLPGRSSTELTAATAALSAALGDHVGDVRAGRAGRATVEDSAALAHFLSTDAPRVAGTYRARVDQVVRGEQAFVPARRLVEAARAVPVLDRLSGGGLVQDRGRVSVEVAAAARRGRWVPLPAASPMAAALVTASRTAEQATGAAAGIVAVSVGALVKQQAAGYDRAGSLPDGLDPEAAAARRSSGAGFSRPTSETLAAESSGKNPGRAPSTTGPTRSTRRAEPGPASTPDPDKRPGRPR